MEWKEYPQKWELHAQTRTIDAGLGSDNRTKEGIQANIEDLDPGTSYAVRLRASSDGKPSPELIIGELPNPLPADLILVGR